MSLTEVLACPACQSRLSLNAKGWRCDSCAAHYPLVDGVPWLLATPEASLWEWKGRSKLLLQTLDAEAEALKAELKDEKRPELTLRRLRKLLQAKVEHRTALAGLLAPLDLAETGSLDLSRAMAVKTPSAQSLTGYYANIHRDWAWETEENAASLACVESVLDAGRELGSVLALGAGSGRLPFDLHRTLGPRLTVAADINPLMLLAARRVLKGQSLRLYEFPIAPLDLDHHAVLRKCALPDGVAKGLPGFELVFADALKPAFAAASFDTVLTPWLVDIIPADFGVLARQVNRLLKPGGVWINFGSLAFNQRDHARNYSFEEVLEHVQAAGFATPKTRRDRIPYMQSPASCHGRVETVTTFAATKERDVELLPYAYLPDWLTDATRPIPRSQALGASMTVHAILLEVIALIDGQRSLRDVAAAFGARHGLPAPEAEASVRNFLVRHYEENAVGRQY